VLRFAPSPNHGIAPQESFGQMYQYPIRDTGYNGK
jgi:hypothetical protein